jgi:hypothetical protein
MSRHSLMCTSIGCDERELARHRNGTQTLQSHVPVDYELLQRWNPREIQKSFVHVANGRQLVSRISGSTVSDYRWRYKRSTVLETGIAVLSRLIYMPSMMEMSLVSFGHDCLVPALRDGSRLRDTEGRVKVDGGILRLSFRPIYHEKTGNHARKEQYSSDELARGACVPLMECSAIERSASVYFD